MKDELQKLSTPNLIEKGKENINLSEFTLFEEEEKENYLVKFGENNNKKIFFQAYQEDHVSNYYYQSEYSIDDFQNKSKGFKSCDNVNEILETMREIFSSKKASIKNEKEKKNIIIILKISLLGGKEQEIKLNLDQKSSDMNEINIELCTKLNLMEKKIKYLENIISNQKNEINELKQWKESYKNEIEQIIENKKDEKSLKIIDSKIIKKKEEIDFLEKSLKTDDPLLQKRTIKYILLYRATRDGNSVDSFHKKCDDISGTLIVIKTNKGMRFGGYTEQIWNIDYRGEGKKDGNGIGFCYSLDLRFIITQKKLKVLLFVMEV